MNATRTRATTANPPLRCWRTQLSKTQANFALGVLAAALCFGFDSSKAFGQGTVNFANRIPGTLVTRVYGPELGDNWWWSKYGNTSNDFPAGTQVYSGALLSGSGWRAQLFAAPGANQPESALQPANPITTFRTGVASGCVVPVTTTLTGVPVDCPVATVQLRVWDDNSGLYPTWSDAVGNWMGVGISAGMSPTFNVEKIGGGTNAPATLLNLQSFNTYRPGLDWPVPPIILQQPTNVSVLSGGNVSFTVNYICPAITRYQWRLNGTNLNISAGITNLYSVTKVLELTNVQPSQAGIYSFVVTNVTCHSCTGPQPATVSSNAVLTVGNPGALTVLRDQFQHTVLNWDGVFFLQSATNVTGPFTDLPGPVVFSPYTNSDASGARFFRLRN